MIDYSKIVEKGLKGLYGSDQRSDLVNTRIEFLKAQVIYGSPLWSCLEFVTLDEYESLAIKLSNFKSGTGIDNLIAFFPWLNSGYHVIPVYPDLGEVDQYSGLGVRIPVYHLSGTRKGETVNKVEFVKMFLNRYVDDKVF